MNPAVLFGQAADNLKTNAGSAALEYRNWNEGDSWTLAVDLYSRDWVIDFHEKAAEASKHEPRILASYEMTVSAGDVETVNNKQCRRITFEPGQEAPAGVREQRWSVLVSEETGTILEIQRTAGQNLGNPSVMHWDDVSLIVNPPYGFPVEILPAIEADRVQRKSAENGFDLILSRGEGRDEEQTVEAVLEKSGEEQLKIRQTWRPGENWWSEYVMFNEGHKEIEATYTSER